MVRIGWIASTIMCLVLGSANADETALLTDRIELEANACVASFSTYYADFSITLSPLARYYETGPKFRIAASESLYKYATDPAKTVFSRGQDTELDFLFG